MVLAVVDVQGRRGVRVLPLAAERAVVELPLLLSDMKCLMLWSPPSPPSMGDLASGSCHSWPKARSWIFRSAGSDMKWRTSGAAAAAAGLSPSCPLSSKRTLFWESDVFGGTRFAASRPSPA